MDWIKRIDREAFDKKLGIAPIENPKKRWKVWAYQFAFPMMILAALLFSGANILEAFKASPETYYIYFGIFGALILVAELLGDFVFFYRVLLPILIGISLVFTYHYVYDMSAVAKYLGYAQPNKDYLDLLFQILATLYAICVAFLLWKGLSDHDMLKQMLNDEANCIETLIGYTHYFNNEPNNKKEGSNPTEESKRAMIIKGAITALLKYLQQYIENIRKGDRIETSRANADLLRCCVDEVAKIPGEADKNDEIALGEVMRALSDLGLARSRRISQLEVKMSPYILFVLAGMSFALLFPFFDQKPASLGNTSSVDYYREICIFCLGTLFSFIIITLFDISSHFSGFWKIKTDAFKDLEELIPRELEKIEQDWNLTEEGEENYSKTILF